MKYLILLFIPITFVYSQSSEIIEKYDNGNKKVLIHFPSIKNCDECGGGVEKITFEDNGDTLLLEKFKKMNMSFSSKKSSFYNYKFSIPILIVNYKKGKRNGEWIDYYENGQIKKYRMMKNGQLDSESIYYKNDGKVKKEYNFKDGIKVDETSYFYYGVDGDKHYRNGTLVPSFHQKGIKSEKIIYYYDQDGSVQKIENYEEGVLISIKNYKDGKKHGEMIDYYNNGKIKSKSMMKNGKKESYIRFNENGQIQYKEIIENGLGKVIYYNEDSSILREDIYKNGQLIN